MTRALHSAESSPPQVFQFRLATLLAATAWAGVVSLALRTPTSFWSGVIAVFTLFVVLAAVLLVIFRAGGMRAMAVGFLVFCVGYLAYLALTAGTLGEGVHNTTTPTGGAFGELFAKIHPPQAVTTAAGGFGSMGGGEFGTGAGGFGGGTMTTMVSIYAPAEFVSICNHALACLLGVIGSIIAQFLYATRPTSGNLPPGDDHERTSTR